jgi:triosephosphate isomerase (TIM)
MRKQIAAANWKMNLDLSAANALLDALLQQEHQLTDNQEVILAVPFPYLTLAKEKLHDKKGYFVAAQNCYAKKAGAYTGEVSAEMIQSLGIDYVIIGHSERREYFAEDNKLLATKIDLLFETRLKPIFCCGETLPIRENGTQNEFVTNQLKESLLHLTAEQLQQVVIAYEPVWAIGTGKTATTDQAQEMHHHIRNVLSEQYGQSVAKTISILYGGSVKASNAAEIFAAPDVDGGLVGGASLIAEDFGKIIDGLK